MIHLITQGLRLIDREIHDLKLYTTAMLLFFAAGVVIQAGIQFGMDRWLNPVNAIFGTFWMILAMFGLWAAGARPLDAMLLMYAATTGGNPITGFNHAMARILIGFFTVWSFVNNVFVILPFYASAAGFGLVLVATPSYFMFRHMSGQKIDWSKWVWFPAVNIGIGILLCVGMAIKQLFS